MRKQYYNSAKKRKEEMKKVEDLVISFSVIRHDIRFTLKHGKDLIWQVNYFKKLIMIDLWSILPIMVKKWTFTPKSSVKNDQRNHSYLF